MSDEKDTKAVAEEKKTDIPVAEEKKEEVVVPTTDDKSTQADVDETVEVPKEFKKLVEEVEKMTVLQLNELVKVLEKRFGVSASAVAVAGPADGGDAEEKSDFTIELTEAGASKIAVIKVVKEVCGLGLKEAKDMVDSVPAELKSGVKKEKAEEIKAKLEGAGASVNLK